MGSLSRWLTRFGERRKDARPVPVDRRGVSGREAKERLKNAHERLREFTKRHTGNTEFVAMNDRQQVVIFSTFRDICTDAVVAGEYRVCRNPGHEAANTGLAKCDEALCPKLNMALKGAA